MNTRTGSTSDRSPWIDVLRAIACMAVVAHHAFHPLYSIENPALIDVIVSIARHGHLGVPAFFVISGFCIFHALERRVDQQGGCGGFWLDRAFRIYPPFWAATLIACLLASLAAPFNDTSLSAAWPINFFQGVSDLTLTASWFHHPSRLFVAWSLHYEIAFYLISGVLLIPALRAPSVRWATFALITVLSLLGARHFQNTPLGLWPLFACGAAVHFGFSKELSRPLRLLSFGYPVVLFVADPASPAHLVAILASGWLAASVRFHNRLPPPPAFLITLGLGSYSIYVIHVPIISPFNNLAGRLVSFSVPAFILIIGIGCVLGVSGGLAFHRWVERPLEAIRHRFGPQRTTRYAVSDSTLSR